MGAGEGLCRQRSSTALEQTRFFSVILQYCAGGHRKVLSPPPPPPLPPPSPRPSMQGLHLLPTEEARNEWVELGFFPSLLDQYVRETPFLATVLPLCPSSIAVEECLLKFLLVVFLHEKILLLLDNDNFYLTNKLFTIIDISTQHTES